jgi:gp16 family phage-associated protein
MNISNRNQGNDIKHRLRQQKMTLKSWAELHGYTLRQVSDVVRGVNQANYGTGREIAEKLGLTGEHHAN